MSSSNTNYVTFALLPHRNYLDNWTMMNLGMPVLALAIKKNLSVSIDIENLKMRGIVKPTNTGNVAIRQSPTEW